MRISYSSRFNEIIPLQYWHSCRECSQFTHWTTYNLQLFCLQVLSVCFVSSGFVLKWVAEETSGRRKRYMKHSNSFLFFVKQILPQLLNKLVKIVWCEQRKKIKPNIDAFIPNPRIWFHWYSNENSKQKRYVFRIIYKGFNVFSFHVFLKWNCIVCLGEGFFQNSYWV